MKDIIIDKNKCIGCGICADKCPDIFELVGNVAVLKIAPAKADEACSRDAAESCPVAAIEIKE